MANVVKAQSQHEEDIVQLFQVPRETCIKDIDYGCQV
jgi:hypothetical protein